MSGRGHYLREELYRLIREDPGMFEFIQSGLLDGIWYRDLEQPEEEWLSPRLKQVFGYRDEGSLRDIGERKHLERQLAQSQRMEAVGQLAGGIAHDFNNLLTVVLGNLELLAEGLGGNEEGLGLVGQAVRAVQRGSDLTGRLLAFARRQTLAPKVLDINKQLLEIDKLLQHTLRVRAREAVSA